MDRVDRCKKVLILLCALLLGGSIYAILYRFGIHIPCVFHKITGLYCPGCGVSRMCMALIKLDFYTAFRSNPVVLCLLPLFVISFSVSIIRYIQNGSKKLLKWQNICLWISIVCLVSFGIMRNIPALSFLRP